MLLKIATILSAILFLWFGRGSLFTDGMLEDFERFGLSRYRRMTGGLEVLGAFGLLVGLVLPSIAVLSASALSLLMLLGIGVRLRVGDRWMATAPALFLLLLNLYVALRA